MPTSSTNEKVLQQLGNLYRAEMAGINRYLHYSFMVMGYNRIPIQKWFRENAQESMDHAILIGEKITSMGGHPPVVPAKVEDEGEHTIKQLLEESLKMEKDAIEMYKELVQTATDLGDIALEELARSMVREEVEHFNEVEKMLRQP